MQAKLKKLSLIAALAGVFATPAAFAQSRPTPVDAGQGTVQFMGLLQANTCSIATGDENKSVTLPTVNTSSLASANNTAGATYFNLSVTNCDASINNARANFEPDNMDGSASGAAAGTYSNLFAPRDTDPKDATAAKNVNLQLLNENGAAITAGVNPAFFAVKGTGTARGATLTYGARYYSTGAASAGNVRTYVKYTMAYN
ncbi:fimbrial protein [Trinickia mobilis]|uniref:fimbrial protein n=1 Tax=Trinickia mobilis TaxID=2816356 RepID=UPI001A8C1ACC|nr:fimbrial protein [Trinickia mobilis]